MGEGVHHNLDEARDRLKLSNPGYLTYEEAASLARCSPRTIQRAIHSGALRAFRPRRRVLLQESDVRAWVESESASSIEQSRQRVRVRRSAPGSVSNLRALEAEVR